MITASEPLEFIPRGRQVVEKHPGPLVTNTKPSNATSENLLLHRLQNVNISLDDPAEFWLIHEKPLKENFNRINSEENSGFVFNFSIQNEDELYVKGNTAVWFSGTQTKFFGSSETSFSCETPIKFAFFCSAEFIKATAPDTPDILLTDYQNVCVCLIDSTSLRIFGEDGEDYTLTLDFPVSKVWTTKYGILLEKQALSTTVDAQHIQFPRVFTLSNPLEEIRPLLLKTVSGNVNYFTEAEYNIILATWDNDLVLLYDYKTNTHFMCIFRKATQYEIDLVNHQNDLPGPNSSVQFSRTQSVLQTNSTKLAASFNKSYITTGIPKNSHILSSTFKGVSMSNLTHEARLQSSLGFNVSVQDVRKIGEIAPPKPIVPELCLEIIWSETKTTKYSENASHGFFHVDLVGQNYICYLLQRTGELTIIKYNKDAAKKYNFGETNTIAAKDAAGLKQMNMFVILSPCGTLFLYSGIVAIGKIHIGGILSNLTTPTNLASSFSYSAIPRRSSLLPTLSVTPDSKFDDDMHALSPVQPLHLNMVGKTGNCCSLRDPAGNRLTVSYPGGKLFRFGLPLICENFLVAKSLITLKNVLSNELALEVITKWYGVRNAPGTNDLCPQKEWQMFCEFLLDLMGYSISWNQYTPQSTLFSSSLRETKKRRRSDNTDGSDYDWNYLLNYTNKNIVPKESLNRTENFHKKDTKAILFNYIPTLLYSMHLMYEDLKLDSTMKTFLESLAHFLYRLSLQLNLTNYLEHYFIDHPKLITIEPIEKIDPNQFRTMNYYAELHKEAIPNIFRFIYEMIDDSHTSKYPIIPNVNYKTYQIVKILKIVFNDSENKGLGEYIKLENLKSGYMNEHKYLRYTQNAKNSDYSRYDLILNCLLEFGITRNYLENLPISLYGILSNVLDEIRLNAPTGCQLKAYKLLIRPELVAHVSILKNGQKKVVLENPVQKEHSLSPRIPTIPDIIPKTDTTVEEDGMEHVDTKLLRFRFPKDLRVNDVRNFLNSSTPIVIDMVQASNVSDHDFIEEQEKYLYAISIRTMSLPLGRGMFTLRTSTPTVTESLPIPKLCLSGKEPVKGSTIEIQQIEVPQNMNTWPLFHNGVAAGLRITPDAKDIDSTWIVYNKPKGITEIPTEHAGFLMALGLNGHLKSLSFMSIYEYLVKCDEMTSLGLLLGISAAQRGTMDLTTTKLLSVHVEALLPPTALELDIPQNIQIASIMGIGLLYQGSAKRHIAEILLQEIGRPPGPEMENSVERESYALTTGLALGLVILGQGETATGLRDLQLTDNLHYYMIGGNKRPLSGSQKEKYKQPSFQIREGNIVNIDVTAPGAILALGLMFFSTNNEAVANWMKPPETRYLLDFIRPDLLMLRIISKGIIMWNSIEPTTEWVMSQFPKSLNFDLQRGPSENSNIDHEANCQAFCNIVTGAAFCVGLRYAGTENENAYQTLHSLIQLFLHANSQYLGKFAGASTIESCLNMVLLSLSLVYAGTGNLNIIRIIRMLRSRVGTSHYSVTYGSHMACHMALGFLFLGAGRFTLSRSPEAIGALICALFPKFPNHSNDNRYHLQAFRHLYVLAVEPRLFLPRDIDSGKLTLCRISYIKIGSQQPIIRNAPCMLPELNTLQAIHIDDPRFWKLSFQRDRNWNQLIRILEKCECIDLKQRAGSFSTIDNPKTSKYYLNQTIKIKEYHHWKVDLNNLMSFSNDENILNLINSFFVESKISATGCRLLGEKDVRQEKYTKQQLMIQANNCLINDKLHSFSIGLGLLLIWKNLQQEPTVYDIWQFKLIEKYLSKLKEYFDSESNHLWIEIMKSITLKLEPIVNHWTNENIEILRRFLTNSLCPELTASFKNEDRNTLQKLSSIVAFYNLKSNLLSLQQLKCGGQTANYNYLHFLLDMKKLRMDYGTLKFLWHIINC